MSPLRDGSESLEFSLPLWVVELRSLDIFKETIDKYFNGRGMEN